MQGQGLSIKGKAGPFVVEASNFAPGTTAADIESALQSDALDDNGVSGMISCRIVSASPTVVAEMVFAERHIADKVISTYHNQRADGRILQLVLKRPGGGPRSAERIQPNLIPQATAAASETLAQTVHENETEDIEMEVEPSAASDGRDRDQRSREPRTTDANGADGRHGFGSPQVAASRDDHSNRAESDRRDRDRVSDRDREPELDRDTNRYDRRDDRASSLYRHEDRRGGYNSRFSHYGNGVGGAPRGRGSFARPDSFARGGGRGYGTDTMRGGRGGGVPGVFGGGYRRGY